MRTFSSGKCLIDARRPAPVHTSVVGSNYYLTRCQVPAPSGEGPGVRAGSPEVVGFTPIVAGACTMYCRSAAVQPTTVLSSPSATRRAFHKDFMPMTWRARMDETWAAPPAIVVASWRCVLVTKTDAGGRPVGTSDCCCERVSQDLDLVAGPAGGAPVSSIEGRPGRWLLPSDRH
jgi:hypothetical protein